MKNLSLASGLLFAAVSSVAYGAPISIGGINMAATADSVVNSYGNFYDYTSTDPNYPISSQQLTNDVTDTNVGTYVFSHSSTAYINLGFSTPIYNGTGADLALFFVGDNTPFSITINGITEQYTPTYTPTPTVVSLQGGACSSSSPNYNSSTNTCDYNLTASQINLDDFGLSGSNTPVTSFKLSLGGVYNNTTGTTTYAAFSLAGSMYTEAQYPTTVPLPLSSVLFASGLGVFGLLARKRSTKSKQS